MKEQRNALIELFRFWAAISIAIYHLGFFVYTDSLPYMIHQYIWVEFFYCLSGYFLAKSQKVRPDREPIPYVVSRIKKLYPLFGIAFIANFVMYAYQNHFSFCSALVQLWESKWEYLLLTMSGLGNDKLLVGGGGPGYISALLIASLPLCWLIGRHEKLFANVIAPAMIFAFYTRIILLTGNLSQWHMIDGFFTLGVLRALAGMSAGALAYLWLYPLFEKADEKKQYSVIIFKRVFLVFSVFMIIGLVAFRDWISFVDLALYVPLFAVLLAVCDTLSPRFFMLQIGNMVRTLGELAYPMFLIHFFVINLFAQYLPTINGRNGRILFLISIMAAAKIMLLLQSFLRDLFGKLCETTPAKLE